MRWIILLTSGLLLASCAGMESREMRAVRNYAAPCEAMGFESGTNQFGNCILTLMQQEDAKNQAIFESGLKLMTEANRRPSTVIINHQQAAPTQSNCRWNDFLKNWQCQYY